MLTKSLPITDVGVVWLVSLAAARFLPSCSKGSEAPATSASDMDLPGCRVCWGVLHQLVTTSGVVTLGFPKFSD